MKVLVTGAAGFLGRGLIIPFEEQGHALRLMDIAPFSSPRHEVVSGDVGDYDQVERAVQGVDGLVIAHMVPQGESYKTPRLPFDVNVKGTANLFHAAVRCGVRRVVVISSASTVMGNPKTPEAMLRRNWPLRADKPGYYRLSKVLQEVIAEHFARTEKMSVACLRVGYILDGDANIDKYGRHVTERNYQDSDRRDIGDVARLCLELGSPGYDIFHVMSTPESMDVADVRYTCERLNWKPRYDFSGLPPVSPSADKKK